MAWNGSGVYSLSASYYPEVNGTTIDAVRYNGLMVDIQSALNNVLCKDGQVAAEANLAMGGFKLTGLAAGTAAGNSVRFEQVWRNGAATIASAATVELGSSAAGVITISGTTTITSFGDTAETGQLKVLIFSGALTLTYNATSMIIPGAANVTTAAGDVMLVSHAGSGNWRVLAHTKIGPSFSVSDIQGINSATDAVNDADNTTLKAESASASGKDGGDLILLAGDGSLAAGGEGGDVIIAPGDGLAEGYVYIRNRKKQEGSVPTAELIMDSTDGVSVRGTGSFVIKTRYVEVETDASNAGNGVAITSGGGSGPSVRGSSHCFEVTMGTGSPTSVVVQFNSGVAFNAVPIVVVGASKNGIVCRATATTSQVTITGASAFSSGDLVSCIVYGVT